MTWTINLSGHIRDRSKEREIADLVRDRVKALAADLGDFGLSSARFYGNEHTENFLEGRETPS